MIAVDASALVAIGDDEPEAERFLDILERNPSCISAVNYVETGLILIGRGRLATQEDLDDWLKRLGAKVMPDENLAAAALGAYLVYGRRYHPAKLNLADCFAYALAKQLDAPLLYKGDDFPLTDIRSALD
ncbi:twitching motility protein PilT [Caulobacter sp. Root655]|uniref:type II toxin-antitoxin system VapC family toxin n=1 Tax=Caulobacter sp. Root655 TaxID=1736578 RepID=UPI0006F212C3|nr:type II toxin-antitoxin system VapC family toxin [Caulobacter sp. Root655]KRA66364.1 twitching motility protein PilT [Caulobacter sp. Root655]